MLAMLVPCGGGPDISILTPKVVIGRQSGCDILLTGRSISARHCELERVDGYWRVRDLGSSNGTRVNGNAVSNDWLLPDDELALGKERFYLVYVPPEGGKPPPRTGTSEVGRKPSSAASVPTVQRNVPAVLTLGELVPCGGGETIPLLKPEVVVGRTADCDVIINANDISSRHCKLEFTEGHWFVHDLGSRNGTRVDNTLHKGMAVLMPNCVLALARHRFRVVYASSAEPEDEENIFARRLMEKAGLENWNPKSEESTGKD